MFYPHILKAYSVAATLTKENIYSDNILHTCISLQLSTIHPFIYLSFQALILYFSTTLRLSVCLSLFFYHFFLFVYCFILPTGLIFSSHFIIFFLLFLISDFPAAHLTWCSYYSDGVSICASNMTCPNAHVLLIVCKLTEEESQIWTPFVTSVYFDAWTPV